MARSPHTWFAKGQKVIVTLHNGKPFKDNFVERKNAVVILKKAGRIKIKNIRQITIYRGQDI
jgi:hypothetical protein